jgi:hypothetical protein
MSLTERDLRDLLAEHAAHVTAGPGQVEAVWERAHRQRRRQRVAAALAVGVAVLVAGLGLTVSRSLWQHKAFGPAAPLPITGPVTTIEPLCESSAYAASAAAGLNQDPMNVPAGRMPSCVTTEPVGRLASAFAYVHGGVVTQVPFHVTLPTGWVVSLDPSQSNGWLSTFAGGSHVLRLRSPDGGSGVDFVSEPNPLELDYADPVMPQHAYGARALGAREANGLADWTQTQPWMRAQPPVPTSVDGHPGWVVDTMPRTGADTEAERGTCDWRPGLGCSVLLSYWQPTGGGGPVNVAAYLRPGTTRLVFFDAPGGPDGRASVTVAAVLWDEHLGPTGLDRITATVQPIINSIRFPATTSSP